MKPTWLTRPAAAAFALLSLAACAGSRSAPAGDCQMEFVFEPPARPHERLGSLQRHVQAPPAGGAWLALRPEACAMGADAVVIERIQVLNLLDQTMVAGYAVRWRSEPPPQLQPLGPPEPPPSDDAPPPSDPTPVGPYDSPVPAPAPAPASPPPAPKPGG